MHLIFSQSHYCSWRYLDATFAMLLTPPSFSFTLIQMGSISSQIPVFSRQLVLVFPLVPTPASPLPSPLFSLPRRDYSFFEHRHDYFSPPTSSPPPLFSSTMPARMDWASFLQVLLWQLAHRPSFPQACWPWAWRYCRMVTASIACCCFRYQWPFSRRDCPPLCSYCLLTSSKTWTYLAFDSLPSSARMCFLLSLRPSMIRRQRRRWPCLTLFSLRAFLVV